MTKHIGFHPQKEEDKPKDNPSDPNGPMEKAFASYIRSTYKPEGETAFIVYRSTSELLYDVREMCTVPVGRVLIILEALGYTTAVIDGRIVWKLYEHSDDSLF
jgi:hypothetical protein